MKKIIAVLLILCTLFLSSCGPKDEIIGEPCTQEDWYSMVGGDFSNYSGTMESDNSILFFYMDGEEWCEKLIVNGQVEREEGEYLIDGELVYLQYDRTTGKWKTSEEVPVKEYPMYNMPYERKNFRYESKTGTYIYSLPKAVELFNKNNIKGDPNIYIKFIDGKCVYLEMPYGVSEQANRVIYVTYHVFDYGTTKITAPDKADIVIESK
jgi:hypothetical protein